MKVLVTGGAGFIGSNLCESLLEQEYEVVCLDNFATGKPENILPLIEQFPKQFHLIVGDIRKLSDCQKAVDGVDYVFAAAALKQVPSCEFFPMEAVRTNVEGTNNVLLSAIDHGVKNVVVLSTDKAAYPINAMGIS